MQRLFSRLELSRPAGEDSLLAFGRFEAARPNELWTGDALHGPVVGGRKVFLFCFIDDHSRAVMGARWAFHEDVVRLAAALRPALAVRGVPEHVYVDNGSAFVDAWLLRACAVLGVKLVHSRPGLPLNPKLRVVWMPRPPLACAFAPSLPAVSGYLRRVSGMAAPMRSKAWLSARWWAR